MKQFNKKSSDKETVKHNGRVKHLVIRHCNYPTTSF